MGRHELERRCRFFLRDARFAQSWSYNVGFVPDILDSGLSTLLLECYGCIIRAAEVGITRTLIGVRMWTLSQNSVGITKQAVVAHCGWTCALAQLCGERASGPFRDRIYLLARTVYVVIHDSLMASVNGMCHKCSFLNS